MTKTQCYHGGMQLLSVQGTGAIATVALLLICIIVVHVGKLARIGYRTRKKKLPPEPPKTPEPEREPVYYIVEKKKKRVKSEYSEPRRISFKEDK